MTIEGKCSDALGARLGHGCSCGLCNNLALLYQYLQEAERQEKILISILIRGSLLFGLWLLLSEEEKGLLLGLGLASALFVAGITSRMDSVDGEGRQLVPGIGILAFWGWLTGQVIRANLDVARRVLDPRLPISPRVFRVRTSQATDLGRVTFANAITLTPGTVSMDLRDNEIEVHALSQEAAEGLASGVMDRMVSAMVEGRRR